MLVADGKGGLGSLDVRLGPFSPGLVLWPLPASSPCLKVPFSL